MCLPGPNNASLVADVDDAGDDALRFIESSILPLLPSSHTSAVISTDLVLTSKEEHKYGSAIHADIEANLNLFLTTSQTRQQRPQKCCKDPLR